MAPQIPGDPVSWRAVDRAHTGVSLVLLAIFVATGAALDIAACNPRAARWFDDQTIAKCRALNRAFVRGGVFGDAFNGLMFEEVPHTDYAGGGIYFFGSSNLVFAAQFGDLPQGQAERIHNFGFPAANATQIFQFIRYLDQTEGFLTSGGGKTHVALCLTEDDLLEDPGAGLVLPSALRDTGVFNYDPREGITPVPMSRLTRSMMLRQLRWYDFIQQFHRLGEPLPPAETDIKAMQQEVERLNITNGGPNPRQYDDLDRMLDYLKAKNVAVTVIRLPKGSWSEGSPLERAFSERVPAMCAAKGIPLLDLSHLLADDEFMDVHHPTFRGAPKVRDALVKFAQNELHQSGVLPTTQDGTGHAN